MQALLEQQGGSIKPLLMQVGFDINSLRKELSKELDRLPKIQNPTGDVNMSQDLARLLNQADRLAQQKGDQFISSELVLLAAMDGGSKLGKLLLERQADDEGIAELHKAQDLEPLRSRAYVAEARWLASKGRIDEAIAKAREATILEPNDQEARTLLKNLGAK